MLVSVILLGIATFQIVTSLNEYTYTQDVGKSGRVPSDVSPTSARSRTECAARCSLESRCGGFYFSRPERECFLELDTVFTNFTVDNAGLHYTKDAPVGIEMSTVTSTVTSPSTTSASIDCLPSSFATVNVQSSSSSNYTFEISVQLVNQSEAMAQCTKCGLQLLQLNDVDKIDKLSQFLQANSTLNSVSFWVDAMRMMNETDTPWRNSGGDSVPTSFWSNETPGSHSDEHCARLDSGATYDLNDALCSWTRYGAICEEQQ